MTAVAVIVFVVLAVIAALHAAWGFRLFWWPAADERGLTALVVGRTGQTRMPDTPACLVAAAAILVAGLVALALADIIDIGAPRLVTAVGVLVVAVFAGRGVATYLPVWRRRFAQQPFATMDRRFYGPLCLLLAAAFALLVLARLGR
jgi:hypothetical protein